MPLIESYRQDAVVRRLSRENFNQILNNPSLFDVFKLNTISNFTTENVIFEFHIQEIYEQVSATLQMGSVPSDTPVPGNLKAKYGEIFRLYICSDSPLVVSISGV